MIPPLGFWSILWGLILGIDPRFMLNHSGSFPKGVIPGCNTKTLSLMGISLDIAGVAAGGFSSAPGCEPAPRLAATGAGASSYGDTLKLGRSRMRK